MDASGSRMRPPLEIAGVRPFPMSDDELVEKFIAHQEQMARLGITDVILIRDLFNLKIHHQVTDVIKPKTEY